MEEWQDWVLTVYHIGFQKKRPFASGLQMEKLEQGQIRIARIESDVLKRSGAELQTVKRCSPEQGASRIPPNIQVRKQGTLTLHSLHHPPYS